MEKKIDARGKACPIPVIMAKKEADGGGTDFTVLVDNRTAVENLTRFGKSGGFDIAVLESGADDYSVRFIKSEGSNSESAAGKAESGKGEGTETGAADALNDNIGIPQNKRGSWAVFIGREGIGDGDSELGSSLLQMYFFTLAQGDDIPDYILFMNNGVKVPTRNHQAIEHLKTLKERSAEILVCGTCLNFYNLADELAVGTVSNMYDIAGAMQAVDKVITL
ncbi:MAG: sulfurtransferase-like selenium metabolism protein YedF [Anaerovoracaceae bacterium]|jgi:selenium metabolism protein YedF